MKDVENKCSTFVLRFRDNYLGLNSDKCHLSIQRTNTQMYKSEVCIIIGRQDSALSFNGQVKLICSKASQKHSAIAELANDLPEYKKKILHLINFCFQIDTDKSKAMIKPIYQPSIPSIKEV